MADEDAIAEHIPDGDKLSRACFIIPDSIDSESAFKFERDRQGNRVESVFWRKYAPTASDLHKRGCELERQKNLRLRVQGKSLKKYSGIRTATAGPIRKIKSERGFQFHILHAPESDDRSHAHIGIEPPPGSSGTQLKPNDMRELVSSLAREFNIFDAHDCDVKVP